MPLLKLFAIAAVLGISSAPLSAQQQLPNPAAQFCVDEGGTYRIVQEAAGERGICVLADGREVDAWEYFRERHSSLPDANVEPAEKIWSGGPILTMVDGNMRVEALAEAQGVIIAAGPLDEVMGLRGPETEMIDLAGRTMIPGFVDAHGHVFMIGIQALSANLLPAPDGTVNDIPALQEVMRAYLAANPDRVARAGLLMGFGYDDAQLAEERHPTRDDLDATLAKATGHPLQARALLKHLEARYGQHD